MKMKSRISKSLYAARMIFIGMLVIGTPIFIFIGVVYIFGSEITLAVIAIVPISIAVLLSCFLIGEIVTEEVTMRRK